MSRRRPADLTRARKGPAVRVIVFAKQPRAGRVKTRLAAAIGPRAACAAYRALLQSVLRRLRSIRGVQVRITPDQGVRVARRWLQPSWSAAGQGRGSLGARLHRAFAEAFRACPKRPVLVVGSDCPSMTRRDIEAARAALASADLVLGPSRDGGYWLVGLNRPCRALFEGIAWSTPRVLAQTLARARRQHLRTALLRKLGDVDTVEDWNRFRRARRADLQA